MHIQALVVAGVLLAASAARAEPGIETPPDRRDHSRIGVNLGIGTPAGDLSIEYAQALHPNVEVAIGGGVSLLGRTGPQVAIMPRARLRRGPITFSAGAGVSAGQYDNISPFAENPTPQITCLFGNAEAGVQVTSHYGPFVRAFAGTGKILAHAHYTAYSEMQRDEVNDVLGYGGLSAGYVF